MLIAVAEILEDIASLRLGFVFIVNIDNRFSHHAYLLKTNTCYECIDLNSTMKKFKEHHPRLSITYDFLPASSPRFSQAEQTYKRLFVRSGDEET